MRLLSIRRWSGADWAYVGRIFSLVLTGLYTA